MNGASLSIHQDLQREAAGPMMPLEENSVGTKSDAAAEEMQKLQSILCILCKQLLCLRSLSCICGPDKWATSKIFDFQMEIMSELCLD